MNKQPVSFLQTDPRWGSLDYSAKGEKTTIRASGCGPTAMAMVLATWADPSVDPKTECAWALAHGYYSEIASIQTLDNLLKMNKINTMQYLERIPDGYIPARRELIQELKEQERQQLQAMQAASQPSANGGNVSGEAEKPDIPTGGGYSALQRKVNETGTTDGVV